MKNQKTKQKKDNIIEGIMKSNGLYCLAANPKVGKSMFALQLAYALTTNQQFLGHNTAPTSIIYVSTESNFSQIQERTFFLGLDFPPKSLFIIDRDEKGEITINHIEEEIKKLSNIIGNKLIIIDMLKDINFEMDYDINNYQDVGQKLLPKLRYLCDKYHLSILFTHHNNKLGKILGSTAFDGVVDGKLSLNEDKKYKTLLTLNIINRDFPELNIQLKKESNQIFEVIETEIEEELDYNLIQVINYVSKYRECKFTCTEIIEKLKLNNITSRRLGRLLQSNTDILKSEGVTLIYKRENQRYYYAKYEELDDEA